MNKLLIVSLILLMVGGMTTLSQAHMSKTLLTCPVFAGAEATKKPRLLVSKTLENGMFLEAYDVNGDGKVDIATYSAIVGGAEDQEEGPMHSAAPIFYEIDLDGDEEGDLLYIDPIGNQECSDLTIYSDEADGGLASWKESNKINQSNEILVAMQSLHERLS